MIANKKMKSKSFFLPAVIVAVSLWLTPFAAVAQLMPDGPGGSGDIEDVGECRQLGVSIMGVEMVCESTETGPGVVENVAYAENMILAYLILVMRLLSVGVGLVITLMIVVSGVQYISSAGNPQKVEAAKTKLRHTLEALLLFIFLSAIINWLVPGGLL